MDYLLDVVMGSVSTFFIAHLFYIIFRSYKVSQFFIIFRLVIAIYSVVITIVFHNQIEIIILTFLTQVIPVLGGAFLWSKYTGVSMIPRFKSYKVKPIKSKIKDETKTVASAKQSIVIFSILPLILALTAFFLIDNTLVKWVVIGVSVIGAITGIALLLNYNKLEKECAIVFIGKNKEQIYEYEIPRGLKTLEVKDFFTNPDFIVDKIGVVTLINEDKTTEKHYLYWIATSSEVSISSNELVKVKSLAYQEHLDLFKKYQFQDATFNVSRQGVATLIKTKKIS